MKTMTEELNEARKHYREDLIPKDALKLMDEATRELENSSLGDRSLKKGDLAPNFSLKDANGNVVVLSELLKEGPVVLAFYRGGWCPYCNIELRGLQKALPSIQAMGASLVAISPELPDNTLSTTEKNHLEFTVLSDIGNQVARSLGIAFELSTEMLHLYTEFEHELAVMNGEKGAKELPVPATFIISKTGVIEYAFVNADYTQRLDPEKILEILGGLKPSSVLSVEQKHRANANG
jgi:peroxiredoxin